VSQPRCQSARVEGSPCRGPAVLGSVWCLMHHPERADQVREARARGGAKAAKLRSLAGRRPKLDDAAGLVRFNADLVHRLLSDELEVDVVRCVVYALSLQRQLIESGDLERRLSELEQRLNGGGAKKWA
jgi:hypothetical protein